jgi:CheY-like chemotaxis protein
LLLWFRDGIESQVYLSGSCGDEIGAIVSDIKMPRMGGLELLAWVKQQEKLSKILFLVLSTSDQEAQRLWVWAPRTTSLNPQTL